MIIGGLGKSVEPLGLRLAEQDLHLILDDTHPMHIHEATKDMQVLLEPLWGCRNDCDIIYIQQDEGRQQCYLGGVRPVRG